jgi:cellulose biosynthesis protein BcsQ
MTDPLGRRIAFMNNKGGVGKSRVATAIGAALAARGRRVLMVDMDPQGNITRRLAVADPHLAVTIGEVLAHKTKGSANAAVYPCGWNVPEAKNIDVIPADLALTDRDQEAAQPGSFNRLTRVLYGLTDTYDFTVFDCRPTLGHLEQMVVRALEEETDGVYLVVEPGTDAIDGAYRVTQTIAGWADDMDVPAPCLGVIVNRYDERLRLHRGRASVLEQSITVPAATDDRPGPPILRPYLPQAVRLAELDDLALPSLGDKRLTAEGITAKLDALAAEIDRAA